MGTDQGTATKLASSPVDYLDEESPKSAPEPGVALCLSGGGYRAMLFHVGVLWRLNELGYLAKLDRISSVSGGSITAGVLGLNWSALGFDANGVAQSFQQQVVDPIRRFSEETLDWKAGVNHLIPFASSASEKVAAAYNQFLFHSATLQNLPNHPRFVFNATNVQSGVLWRFMKPYMRDYRVGEVKKPVVELAQAVAASSAFPPFLSPLVLEVPTTRYTPDSGTDLQREPFTSKVELTDGGVYDNLGLETAWKRFDTILVSDAGQKMEPDSEPSHEWAMHLKRILDIVDNQVRSLRKRQVISGFVQGERKGAYWGIRTNIKDYVLESYLQSPFEKTVTLAQIPTRLAFLEKRAQEELINWGYAVCDAAMRKHVVPHTKSSPKWPYPGSALG